MAEPFEAIYRFFNLRTLKAFLRSNKLGMDPVTAIFNFLATPEGQKLIDPLVKLDTEFITIIMDFIKKIHASSGASNTNSKPAA